MHAIDQPVQPSAIRTDLGAIFVSLELSHSTWLITSLSAGNGEKMSKHSVSAGSHTELFARFAQLQERSRMRTGHSYPIIVIQEAGLDGFWLHRILEREGIESHVVDPASIATSRRSRRAKTDRLDGETLVRTLLAYRRREPRVCAMVKAPSPEEEDRRRVCRERKALTVERVGHVNRIKGLLFSQGITEYEPVRRDRQARLEKLRSCNCKTEGDFNGSSGDLNISPGSCRPENWLCFENYSVPLRGLNPHIATSIKHEATADCLLVLRWDWRFEH